MYGDNFAAKGIILSELLITEGDRRLTIKESVSGWVSEPLEIGLYDEYGSIVTTDNAGLATIVPLNSTTKTIGSSSTNAESGVYTFQDLTIIDTPGSTVYFEIFTSAINYALSDPLTDAIKEPYLA